MPIHADVLGIRETSDNEAWAHKRACPRHLAHTEMQSVGWQRLRPCALNQCQKLASHNDIAIKEYSRLTNGGSIKKNQYQ